MSTSCMRYAREFAALRTRLAEVGELRAISISMCKSWERYGIHALEAVYPFLEPGRWHSIQHIEGDRANILHVQHKSAVSVVILIAPDLFGGFGCLNVHGTKDSVAARFDDTFYAFRSQLEDFIGYLRTGQPPFPFAETCELAKLVIAGIRSRARSGELVLLDSIEGWGAI